MPRVTIKDINQRVDELEGKVTAELNTINQRVDANYKVLDQFIQKVNELNNTQKQVDDIHATLHRNGLVPMVYESAKYITEQREKSKSKRERIRKIFDRTMVWLFRLMVIYFFSRWAGISMETLKGFMPF